MRNFVAICIFCLLSVFGFSQFPIHSILPMGVSGIMLGDTLLNTRAILQREGITKVTAVETSTQQRKGASFTTTYLVGNGQIRARYWCYRPAPDTAFRFCTRDTLLYNSSGELQEQWAGESREKAYMRTIVEHDSDRKISVTWIMKDPRRSAPDTSIYHYTYNAKGQLICQHKDSDEKNCANARLFYNADGLVDSIRHENPAWGTYVFLHKRKGDKIVLTFEKGNATYQWIYNQLGQCIASEYSSKHFTGMRNGAKGNTGTEIEYFYNDDGTLKKVKEKRGDYEVTTVYSYTK